MTVFGSICTRFLIDRTLIRNAILHHFQITLFCGPINRIFIPLTLFLLSRPLEQLEFIVLATCQQKDGSVQSPSYNGICSHTNSKVDIDDISLTLNFFLNSDLRDDLLINFLVSLFTSYKNFTSFEFNLGRMCLKQTSSLSFTTKPHKESLSPTPPLPRFFCAPRGRSRQRSRDWRDALGQCIHHKQRQRTRCRRQHHPLQGSVRI